MTKKNSKAGEMIARLWGDLPVKDADTDLRVCVLPSDMTKAVKGDGAYCLFAQACKRMFGSTKALFLRSVAYVDLEGSDGERRVERFGLEKAMRNLIEKFDRGHPVQPKGGFLLKRPWPSKTLDAEKRKTQKKQAKAKVLTTAGSDKKNVKKKQIRINEFVAVDLLRNGSGRVKFPNLK